MSLAAASRSARHAQGFGAAQLWQQVTRNAYKPGARLDSFRTMAMASPMHYESDQDTGKDGEPGVVAMETVAKKAPVTAERNVSLKDIPNIEYPHLPRALAAVDAQHPQGTLGRKHNGYTVLQQHCAFFDRDGDGVIFPRETYQGFRALGYTRGISALAAFIINGSFSYPTLNVFFHGLSALDSGPSVPYLLGEDPPDEARQDTEVYDTEARFLPSKFEELFNKYAKTRPDAMTYDEILRMVNSMRNVNDPYGWGAAKLEWGFTYWLIKDKEGFATKEAIRGIYDGSIFDTIEKEIKEGKNRDKPVELHKI